MYGRLRGAFSLDRLSASVAGSPEQVFEIEGRTYTHGFLAYYYRYAYCAPFIDFDSVRNIVEIGCGAGSQVEVIKKAHPHINFYLLDLAVPAYVCGQYLRAVFPDDVVDYRKNRAMSVISTQGRGSIQILGNFQIGAVAPQGRTLFWNAASFAEMEPFVVENYFSHLKKWSDAIYLFQNMGGALKSIKGRHGVIDQVKFEHYERFLGDDFALSDRSPGLTPLIWPKYSAKRSSGYENALWMRKTQS